MWLLTALMKQFPLVAGRLKYVANITDSDPTVSMGDLSDPRSTLFELERCVRNINTNEKCLNTCNLLYKNDTMKKSGNSASFQTLYLKRKQIILSISYNLKLVSDSLPYNTCNNILLLLWVICGIMLHKVMT